MNRNLYCEVVCCLSDNVGNLQDVDYLDSLHANVCYPRVIEILDELITTAKQLKKAMTKDYKARFSKSLIHNPFPEGLKPQDGITPRPECKQS